MSQGFHEVTTLTLIKKTNATKCIFHHTISLIAHIKSSSEGIERNDERTIVDVHGGDRFGFRSGKGTRDT
jgi:hypothetical protein